MWEAIGEGYKQEVEVKGYTAILAVRPFGGTRYWLWSVYVCDTLTQEQGVTFTLQDAKRRAEDGLYGVMWKALRG